MTDTATARCNYLNAVKATDAHQELVQVQTELVAKLQFELYQATKALDEMEAEHLALLEAEEECHKASYVTYQASCTCNAYPAIHFAHCEDCSAPTNACVCAA